MADIEKGGINLKELSWEEIRAMRNLVLYGSLLAEEFGAKVFNAYDRKLNQQTKEMQFPSRDRNS